ncbi:hypothetical protein DFJ73DRAFT_493069 [Zopfochytrium polystomum]|nr:hypothetical protein DFJ73DRAFT_493069 [Zopfochytrium polystomum]
MLLRLVKAEEHEDTDAWIVPRTKSADDLLSDCKIIQDFIEKPFDDDGKPLSKFLKKRSKKRRTKRKESDGPPAKRVKSSGAIQSSLSKQVGHSRLSLAYLSVYLHDFFFPFFLTSFQFVDSSDEDDDEEFFEKERQLRAKVAAAAAATAKMPIHALAAATASRPVKEQKVAGRRVNAKRHNLEALVSDSDDDDSRSETIIPTPRRRAPINVFESDSEVEDGNQGSDDQGKASQPTTSPAAIDSGFADEGNSSGDGGVGADKMGRPEVNGYMGSTHSRSLSVFSDSE